MPTAMLQIRSEVGPNALILSTRRAPEGIEVTVGLEDESGPEPAGPEESRTLLLTYHSVPESLWNRLSTGNLSEALTKAFRFQPLSLHIGGSPVLLAGPPGAGKTLTAARLATRLVVKGIVPLVITADAQRAGGEEQLAAFTRLLGVRLLVAANPQAMVAAVRQRAKGAPVIVDLAGGNPFQSQERLELAEFATAASGILVTVLPAGLDVAEAADLASAYLDAGARHLVVTRLDVTRRIGAVLSAADVGLALSEAGVGVDVAGGLVPFTPAMLAQRLMTVPGKGIQNG